MCFRVFFAALALLTNLSVSSASLSIEWVPVDNTDALDEYTTVDLIVHSEVGVCCGALLVELERGEIFYFTFGDPGTFPYIEADKNGPPPQALIDIGATFPEFAAVAYTSYVTINGEQVYLVGGAGDVGGDGLAFTDTEIDVSWYSFSFPAGAVHMARLTLSNDSVGTWGFAVAGDGIDTQEYYGSISNLIPEPGSLGLMMLCGPLLCRPVRVYGHTGY